MGKLRIRAEETPRYEGAPTTTPYRISTVSHWMPFVEAGMSPNPSYMDRNDEDRGNLSPTAQFLDRYAPAGSLRLRPYINQLAILLHAAGMQGTLTAGAGTNEVEQIAQGGTWTGGTFTLTYSAQQTAAIPYNATAAQVQAALEALSNIGVGDVVCGGGPLPTSPVTVTFQGLLAARDITPLTGDATGLTGTTPVVTITTPTPGAAGAVLDPDGNGIPTGATRIQYAKRAGATAKSLDMQLSYDDVAMFEQGQGYGVSQVQMPGSGEFSADLIGLVLRTISDPGVAAALDTSTIIPLRSARLLLTWLTGGANVEGGSFGFTITNPIQAASHHGIRSDYPSVLEYAGQDGGIVRLTGNLSARQFDQQDWDAMMAATRFSAKADYLGDTKIASSGAFYRMWVEMPACQIVGGNAEAAKNQRRHGAQWEFNSAYDETAGYDFRITLLSGLTASPNGLEVFA